MIKYLFLKNKGVTLIELIIIIAVGAVCVVPLLAILGTAVKNTANTEFIAKSIFLAQEDMERLLATDFYDLPGQASPTTMWWPDAMNFPNDMYWRTIEIQFINPNVPDFGIDTGLNPAALPSGSRSNYLRIRVTIQRIRNVVGPGGGQFPAAPAVTLVSLATPHNY